MARKKQDKQKPSLLWRATKASAIGVGKGVRGVYRFARKKSAESAEKKKIIKAQKKLEENPIYQMPPSYEKFELENKISGDYDFLEKRLNKDSIIALIFGKRGSGKSALGFKLLENIHDKSNRKCFVLGVGQEVMPKWISPIENIEEVPDNSVVLVDEGAISFNSRESMNLNNKGIGKLMAIARHKDLTILFITQNTGMIDKNVLKLVDTLLIKQGSLLQQEMERGEVKKFYEKADKALKKLDGDKRKYVYMLDSDFEGVVSVPLPNFWSEGLSKNKG